MQPLLRQLLRAMSSVLMHTSGYEDAQGPLGLVHWRGCPRGCIICGAGGPRGRPWTVVCCRQSPLRGGIRRPARRSPRAERLLCSALACLTRPSLASTS